MKKQQLEERKKEAPPEAGFCRLRDRDWGGYVMSSEQTPSRAAEAPGWAGPGPSPLPPKCCSAGRAGGSHSTFHRAEAGPGPVPLNTALCLQQGGTSGTNSMCLVLGTAFSSSYSSSARTFPRASVPATPRSAALRDTSGARHPSSTLGG